MDLRERHPSAHTPPFFRTRGSAVGLQINEDESSRSEPSELGPAAGDPRPLIEALRTQRSFLFRAYRPTVLLRSVQRRMFACGIDTYESYAALIERDPSELWKLNQGLYIPYTTFFRDMEVWDRLQQVVAELIARSDSNTALRIWSAGCASGQEAVSLAMILAERLNDAALERMLIFASDPNARAMNRARRAIYWASEVQTVPRRLRELYFVRRGATFELRRRLRDRIVFSQHDLLTDPPFSRLDLILCRNTLMYFTPEVRTNLLDAFHYALRDGGYLALGKQETVVELDRGFERADELALYQRVPLPCEPFRLARWLRSGCNAFVQPPGP